MEPKELEAAVEAILFASGEPVRAERLCLALEMSRRPTPCAGSWQTATGMTAAACVW